MIDFLIYLFLLLLPILAILIVRLKRRQKLVYSHAYLKPFQEERLWDLLFRRFQLYYDVLFDLLLAVLLALLFSGLARFSGSKTAVVLDGSYSMIGAEEETPLDRALSAIFEGGLGEEKARFFLLGFNPTRGRHELFALRRWPKLAAPEQASKRLLNKYRFFSMDLSLLQRLYDRNFRRVVFLTDRFPDAETNLEVQEVGEGSKSFFYPLSSAYDFATGRFRIHLFRQNLAEPIGVERFLEAKGQFRAAAATEVSLPGSDFTVIEVQEEGLYRIVSSQLDFTFQFRKPVVKARSAGDFSRILVEVLPQLEEGEGELLLADLPYGPEGLPGVNRKIRALAHYPRRIVTLLPEEEVDLQPYIHPLERSLSQPSYAEVPPEIFRLKLQPDILLFQDPRRIRDPQTPLVVLDYLEVATSSSFASTPRFLSVLKPSLFSSGISSYIYTVRGQKLPLNLPPEEFFHLPPQRSLVFTRREINNLPWFLLLLALYLVKIGFLYRFQAGRLR